MYVIWEEIMKKEELIKNIIKLLSILQSEISLSNSISYFDINITSETFYADLLNLIFDYRLVNLNIVEKNITSIDLGDKVSRIAYQVTSDNSSTKIIETVKKFKENKMYQEYDNLYIFLLRDKKKYTTKKIDTEDLFEFELSNILDNSDLINKVRSFPLTKIELVNKFLKENILYETEKVEISKSFEVETIIELINYISTSTIDKYYDSVIIDPEFKIEKRFKKYADIIKNQYSNLGKNYGSLIKEIKTMLINDAGKNEVIKAYLQDISILHLEKNNDNPIEALNSLVEFFENEISKSGIKYDRSAIKYFLIHETISCSVFPNIGINVGDYNDD